MTVDPDLIDVGPHIVREFVGEVNFTTPEDPEVLMKEDFTDLVILVILTTVSWPRNMLDVSLW